MQDSMQENQAKPKKSAQTQQLSTWEKIKVGSALLGSGFFAWATIFNYSTRKFDKAHPKDSDFNIFSAYHYPTIVSCVPVGIVQEPLKMSYDTAYNIVASYTALLTIFLGRYAYKKLIKPNHQPKQSAS